ILATLLLDEHVRQLMGQHSWDLAWLHQVCIDEDTILELRRGSARNRDVPSKAICATDQNREMLRHTAHPPIHQVESSGHLGRDVAGDVHCVW
ncbi:hypothetical protein, partial [Escherichia coli]|uniref:hypothetical protein n=1 Tax=Escherichia coli TaxID=562 RepID=UPI0019821CD5